MPSTSAFFESLQYLLARVLSVVERISDSAGHEHDGLGGYDDPLGLR